jgi:16S rRNA (uracil1498-N3)-methyltransferase
VTTSGPGPDGARPRRWAASAGARALLVVDDLEPAEPVRHVDGPDGHHLARVRRLGVDERVVVADGDGHWYEARIAGAGRDTLDLERHGPTETEPHPTPRLTVAFAVAKRDHGAEVTHQLVELGVDRVVPLAARHGVVRWEGEKAGAAVDRLQRVAREAAQQAHRARVPRVDAPVSVGDLAGHPGLVVADHAAVVPPGAPGPDAGAEEWVLVVGPEGGFTPEERALLTAAAHLTVGHHVLRAVTAPVAAAAVLATRRG